MDQSKKSSNADPSKAQSSGGQNSGSERRSIKKKRSTDGHAPGLGDPSTKKGEKPSPLLRGTKSFENFGRGFLTKTMQNLKLGTSVPEEIKEHTAWAKPASKSTAKASSSKPLATANLTQTEDLINSTPPVPATPSQLLGQPPKQLRKANQLRMVPGPVPSSTTDSNPITYRPQSQYPLNQEEIIPEVAAIVFRFEALRKTLKRTLDAQDICQNLIDGKGLSPTNRGVYSIVPDTFERMLEEVLQMAVVQLRYQLIEDELVQEYNEIAKAKHKRDFQKMSEAFTDTIDVKFSARPYNPKTDLKTVQADEKIAFEAFHNAYKSWMDAQAEYWNIVYAVARCHQERDLQIRRR